MALPLHTRTIAGVLSRILIVSSTLGIAYLLSAMLRPMLGRENLFLFGLLSVLIIAYSAGFIAAMVGTALATAAIGVTMFGHSIHPQLYDELLPPSIFFALAVGASWFIVARRRAGEALVASNRQLHELYDLERQARLEVDAVGANLRKSEERYRIAAAISRDVLWEWTIPIDRVTWSDGMARIFGYKPNTIGTDSRWWQNRISADDRDRVLASFDLALGSNALVWMEEFGFRRADGTYATVVNRAQIVRETSGAPLRMIGSMLDMSDLKLAERALRESQRFLLRLIKSVPSPVLLLDGKGKIVLFNRACEEISGYRRREVIGKTIPQALLLKDDAREFERRTVDPYAPEAAVPHESHWKTKAGEIRIVQWSFTPVPAPNGELRTPFLLGAGMDITERRTAELAS